MISRRTRETAVEGHVGTQMPQPIQRAGSTWAFSSSPTVIASIGHRSSHVLQPIHTSSFTHER
jgi:hypothetical protein